MTFGTRLGTILILRSSSSSYLPPINWFESRWITLCRSTLSKYLLGALEDSPESLFISPAPDLDVDVHMVSPVPPETKASLEATESRQIMAARNAEFMLCDIAWR